MIAFGPIPSRRLGRSLGINHIPPKSCTYSCTYCQVGRSTDLTTVRREFYQPAHVVADVTAHVQQLQERGEAIDWLSFVPDGEPTLDVHLGRHLELLRPLGIPMAVITNGTLLGRPDVRLELAAADWVCVKVDAVEDAAWNRLDRPHLSLRLDEVLDGIRTFAAGYRGELATDTMLVAGVYDSAAHLERLAGFVAALRPRRAFLSVPTRPPAVSGVRPPAGDVLKLACDILSACIPVVERLFGEHDGELASTGDAAGDLLRIAAVHPVQRAAAVELLARAGAPAGLLERMLAVGLIREVSYGGRQFLVPGAAARGGAGAADPVAAADPAGAAAASRTV
jgi:wyosine [tRNA(Phe)-imidazoG37] synthetase (radical SAM superfamily)